MQVLARSAQSPFEFAFLPTIGRSMPAVVTAGPVSLLNIQAIGPQSPRLDFCSRSLSLARSNPLSKITK
jgi:hypothetical protein